VRALVGTGVLVAIALATSGCGDSHPSSRGTTSVSPGPEISVRTVSSNDLILGGRVRCTATVTAPVEAGHELALSFSLHNVSGSPVKAAVVEGSFWLAVKAADGTTYDTRTALGAEDSHGGPYRTPVTIAPGATKPVGRADVFVRWKGPLRILPGCEQTRLPPLHVGVASPGAPPDDQTAIADVVEASGGLLDRCRPQKPGVAVQGEIDAPDGDAPPMNATCSVTLRSEGRFLVAQALVLVPPGLRGVRVRQPYEVVSLPKLPRPYEAIAWEFVVTKEGAETVAGMTRDATKPGGRMAPGWYWLGSRWSGPDSSRCGYVGLAGGPSVDFIDVCPS
jgi:hypothetical protein